MKFAILALLGIAAAAPTITETIGGLGDGVYLTTEVDGKVQYELLNTTSLAAPQTRDVEARAGRSFVCNSNLLNDNDLYNALHALAGTFGGGYNLATSSISSIKGSVLVFVCNYNGGAGSQWSSNKLWEKNTETNTYCGNDYAGHINEPKTEGNFGRTFSTDHFC